MTIRDEVRECLSRTLGQPLERITEESLLADIVLESFRLVEVAIELQEEFSVRLEQADLSAVETVGDLSELIAQRSRQVVGVSSDVSRE
jgi:acyl carrier protein